MPEAHAMADTPEPSPTRVLQVIQLIRGRIDRHHYTPGARIPSVRAMAELTGVSRSTVVEAYDRLAAEGLVQARPGSGFYVTAPVAPLDLAKATPSPDPAADPLWVMRQSLHVGPDTLRPGCGWLPLDWMPDEAMRKALRAIAREGSEALLFEYGAAEGGPELRAWLARQLREQGVAVAPDQVMLTDSGSQSIDLVCRYVLSPGDTVMVDDPCYFNFQALLRAHRAEVVGVPMTPSGPDLAAFDTVLRTRSPRLYITNSGLHNPTGASLSPAIAHRLLKLAEPHDLVIVEDDIFGDFEEQPAARLAAFDGLDRVVRVGSFSKTLSASVRCGYIASSAEWVRSLADLRLVTGMGSSPVNAELVSLMLTDGSYRHHMERVRARLATLWHDATRRLAALGIVPWLQPTGGMFLWCRLPGGRDATEVARRALRENVVLAPGNTFSPSGQATDFLRLNVAHLTDTVYDVLARAVA